MTLEECRAAVPDLAYLIACVLNGQTPDTQRVAQMDLTALYQTADSHLLTGITAMALERAGVKDAAFTQAKGKAIRKAVLFDAERSAVLAELEKAGIWYLPLKGCVLKDLYPGIGMRQMSDNDILYDASRTDDVKAIMEGLGFVTDSDFGRGIHDHYFKPPVLNFEMHRMLFGSGNGALLIDYYREVRNRLIPEKDKEYGYRFSDEDFYIYMIAHENKHYSCGGTGLRSLLDTYVYVGQKGESLDWAYIEGEMDKLETADFEAQNRSLALHLFRGEKLSESEEKMLDYILSSGTYGTVGNRVKNTVAQYGEVPFPRLRYVFGRIFLPMETIKNSFPRFAKYPVLLPFLPFYRIFKGLTKNRNKIHAELKALKKSKSDCGRLVK